MKPLTLAGAYEQANQGQLELLHKQLELDFKRFNLELLNQKEQHEEQAKDRKLWVQGHEERLRQNQKACEDAHKLQEAEAENHFLKVATVQEWLEEGKSQ